MTQKRKIAFAAVLLAIFAGIFAGIFFLSGTFTKSMDSERKNQMNQIITQVSKTFNDALMFNRSRIDTASKLFVSGDYGTAADISAGADKIGGALDIGEDTLIFIDKDGYCYDKDTKRGIWGDFDSLASVSDTRTFISDSATYEGTHWAFAKKLESPVTTRDGSAEITYAVLLCPVDTLSGYYISESYSKVGETYILKENGTRMYDSLTDEDTISSYNIYKTLRASDNGYGSDFDDVLKTLEETGTASGIYVQNGERYCYSLARYSENQLVILYLVPASMVAADTASMVSSMTRVLVYVAIVMVILLGCVVYIVTKTSNDRKLSAQKEENIRKTEQMNIRLKAMNESLNDANKAAKSALAVAESANHAKSRFLSSMSHDIRTPLNAILGFQRLTEASADNPEKVREYSEKIEMSGKHLLALIDDILDMSRIESGKTMLNFEPFKLTVLIDDLKTLMTPQTQSRHQTFIVNNKAGELLLRGDKERLNQVLTNLLSNAVKYTQDGGKIELTAERLAAKSRHIAPIRFTVRDNGMGMGKEFQKRIFEPFARDDAAIVNGISGTGLGMSITKNLVDLMGGIITLESCEGKGSTFTVEISFNLADADDERVVEEKDTDSEGVLDGKHFLLADDVEINVEILKALLEMENASCDVAQNGKEAVDMFVSSAPGTYDAILMDVQMPVMDGYEATERIRASEHAEAKTVPIVALTANAFAEDVQKALEAGMNTHIAKPVDMKKLREFIATI